MSKHTAKTQHTFKLVAVEVVDPQTAYFETVPAGWMVTLPLIRHPDRVILKTTKGEYTLMKHVTMNYYHGECAGVKVQVSLKKQVGEIRAWY